MVSNDRVVEQLTNGKPCERLEAVAILERVSKSNDRYVKFVLGLVVDDENEDQNVRCAALQALGTIYHERGCDEAICRLAVAYCEKGTVSMRVVALELLRKLATSANWFVIEALVGRLGDGHKQVRNAAVQSLSEIVDCPSARVAVLATQHLQSTRPEVRRAATDALALLAPLDFVQKLAPHCATGWLGVEEALEVLARVSEREGACPVAALAPQLSSPHVDLRVCAVRILARLKYFIRCSLKDSTGIASEVLYTLQSDTQAKVKMAAEEALRSSSQSNDLEANVASSSSFII